LIVGSGGLGLWALALAKAMLPTNTHVVVADISVSHRLLLYSQPYLNCNYEETIGKYNYINYSPFMILKKNTRGIRIRFEYEFLPASSAPVLTIVAVSNDLLLASFHGECSVLRQR